MMTKTLNTLLINSLCLVIGWLSIAQSFSPASAKEPPYLEVELESDELFVGESTTLQVAVHNADQPSAPSMKPLEELFEVAFLGEQSLNQSSTMIINGRISVQARCSAHKHGHVSAQALCASHHQDYVSA